MFRRLDDDLVGADAVHPIEEALAFAIEIPFNLQRRVLVRHDAHVPARSVWLAAIAKGQDLGRRHALVAGTERTVRPADESGVLHAKVVGTLAAIGRDDDPAVGDDVSAKFGQVGSRFGVLCVRGEGVRIHDDLGRARAHLDGDNVEPAWAVVQPMPG